MAESVAILGAGGWGTALAVLLSGQGHRVHLWVHDPVHARSLKETRENPAYLPGVRLPEDIQVSGGFQGLLDARVVVLATPSAFLRGLLTEARPFFRPGQLLVNTAKGVERDTLCLPSEVVAQVLESAGSGFRCRLATLSGPSHAEEISRGLPASVVAASQDAKAALETQRCFGTHHLRVYTSGDLRGVELAGALKNVIALGAGIADGLELGDSARAALITRGLAEISRLGLAMGAQAATFAGLAGLGDLVVTCNSPHSRNHQVGEWLGQGQTLAQIQARMVQVAEGVATAASAEALSRKYGVELPICTEVYRVLYQDKPARRALQDLMARAVRPEEA
jgi:glycerol-3-phosphate dehydrogenase (NAD(P)+)